MSRRMLISVSDSIISLLLNATLIEHGIRLRLKRDGEICSLTASWCVQVLTVMFCFQLDLDQLKLF